MFWFKKLSKYCYSCFFNFFLLRYFKFLKKNGRSKFLINNLCIPVNAKDYFDCQTNINSYNNITYNYNLQKITNSRKQLFDFSKDEILLCKKFIDNYKIDIKNFVCLHNRDNFYLNKKFPNKN